MALQLFPDVSKTMTTSDGIKYAYVSIPAASESHRTFLLLHGFPSGTFDWRHIIPKLRQAGYGIVAPDLLGYGDTDKPAEVEAYSHFRMAKHMVEILKAEGLDNVIALAHDWGCALLSTTALTYPEYFSGLAFLAVGYIPPGPFNIDLVNSLSMQHFGHACYGYMKFFIEDDAAAIIDAHAASLTSLLYSQTPEDWKVHMGPEGAARKWVTANKIAPPPSWMTQEEVDTHIRLFEKGGYTGPLNWYKSYVRGIDEPHYSKLTTDESKRLDIPTLLITAEYDYACHAAFQRPSVEKYLPNHRIEQLACSHWMPSEKPDETVRLLEDWVKSI